MAVPKRKTSKARRDKRRSAVWKLGFIIPAQRSASGEFCSRIALLLLRKHKFQVNLVVGIVLNKHTEISTLPQEVLKVFTLLDNLIYREFQFCFPR